MREILFKGKRLDNGEWVEGGISMAERRVFIVVDDKFEFHHEIDPLTLCEFTGCVDKNGKKIFENDKVKIQVSRFKKGGRRTKITEDKLSCIVYNHHGFWVKDEGFGWEGEGLWDWEQIEVIGNIHDQTKNP